MRTLIYNCRLYVDGRMIENCFILLDACFIKDFGIENGVKVSYDAKYDAKGRLILPGIIDAHVHLRDQLLSYKEDFKSGTASAVLGGVTSVIDMPNNLPPTDSPTKLKDRMSLARNMILANVGFTCKPSIDYAINRELIKQGAIAFKAFVYEYIDDDINLGFLEKIMSTIAKMDKKLMLHCNIKASYKEVINLVKKRNMAKLCKIEGYLTKRILSLAAKHGTKIHICHVSCPTTLKAINQYKDLVDVTSEVTIHHLLLNYDLVERIGPLAHVDPPLKSKYTAKTLFKLLREGYIDIIVSDHAPHALNEKCLSDPKPGFPNLQLMMPILLTQVKKGNLLLSDVIEKASRKPALIFKLEKRGAIKKGYYADLVEVDLKRKFKVKSDMLTSKAKYTPFEGMTLIGLPIRTYVNGICVNDDYTIIGRGGEGMILTGEVSHYGAKPETSA
ncbi:MAG: dihydroorotase [Candidatus Nezhaarchaeales archaeon]